MARAPAWPLLLLRPRPHGLSTCVRRCACQLFAITVVAGTCYALTALERCSSRAPQSARRSRCLLSLCWAARARARLVHRRLCRGGCLASRAQDVAVSGPPSLGSSRMVRYSVPLQGCGGGPGRDSAGCPVPGQGDVKEVRGDRVIQATGLDNYSGPMQIRAPLIYSGSLSLYSGSLSLLSLWFPIMSYSLLQAFWDSAFYPRRDSGDQLEGRPATWTPQVRKIIAQNLETCPKKLLFFIPGRSRHVALKLRGSRPMDWSHSFLVWLVLWVALRQHSAHIWESGAWSCHVTARPNPLHCSTHLSSQAWAGSGRASVTPGTTARGSACAISSFVGTPDMAGLYLLLLPARHRFATTLSEQ